MTQRSIEGYVCAFKRIRIGVFFLSVFLVVPAPSMIGKESLEGEHQLRKFIDRDWAVHDFFFPTDDMTLRYTGIGILIDEQ